MGRDGSQHEPAASEKVLRQNGLANVAGRMATPGPACIFLTPGHRTSLVESAAPRKVRQSVAPPLTVWDKSDMIVSRIEKCPTGAKRTRTASLTPGESAAAV